MGNPSGLEKIISDFANNNKQAFDELYYLYYPKLFAYSRSFLKIEDGIDDILQEVFVKLWLNRQNIKKAETFNAYLYTITKNTLLNEIRSRLKSEEFRSNLYYKSVAEEFVVQQTVEYEDIKQKIDAFVQMLPEKRQRVYLLSREDGKTNNEIAEELGISVKTVEDHMTHALRFIKSKLKPLGLIFLLYYHLFY